MFGLHFFSFDHNKRPLVLWVGSNKLVYSDWTDEAKPEEAAKPEDGGDKCPCGGAPKRKKTNTSDSDT